MKNLLFNRHTLIALLVIGIVAWGVRVLYFAEPLIPVPDQYQPGAGARYAVTLAEAGQRLSLVLVVSGWICVTVGALFAITAALVGASRAMPEEGDSIVTTLLRQRGLICSAFAIILVATGWQLLDRSSAAALAASVATRAISSIGSDTASDRKAYSACIEAKASWLEGRMNHDRVLSIVSDLRPFSEANNEPPGASQSK